MIDTEEYTSLDRERDILWIKLNKFGLNEGIKHTSVYKETILELIGLHETARIRYG